MEIEACRICLTTDKKLYHILKFNLNNIYEDLIGYMAPPTTSYLCIHCATILKKFENFKMKALTSEQLLNKMLDANTLITTSTINNLRSTNKYEELLTAHKNEFILKIEYEDSETPVIPKIELNYDETNDNKVGKENELLNESNQINESLNESNQINESLNESSQNNESNQINDSFDDDKIETFSDDDDDDIKSNDSNIKLKLNTNNGYININPFNDIEENSSLNENRQSLNENRQSLNENQQSLNDIQNNDREVNETSNDEFSDIQSDVEIDLKKEKVSKNVSHDEFDIKFLSYDEIVFEMLMRKESDNYTKSLFKCELCYKGFIRMTTLNNHMEKHNVSKGKFECEFCKFRFKAESQYRRHKITIHERKYSCKLCETTKKCYSKMKEHIKWHKGVKFTCHCDRQFDCLTTYLSHLRIKHKKGVECQYCGQTFLKPSGLKTHLNKNMSCRISYFECNTCAVRFRNKKALITHLRNNDGICDTKMRYCEYCGLQFTSQGELDRHVKGHNKKKWRCKKCNKRYSCDKQLSIHYKQHHCNSSKLKKEDKPICVCEVCGVNLSSRLSLRSHLRIHSGERPYACQYCPARFMTSNSRTYHERSHTNERPFPCSQCGKAFKCKAALNRHMMIHTGLKPYTCVHCNRSFSQSNSLKQHISGVHMNNVIYRKKRKPKEVF